MKHFKHVLLMMAIVVSQAIPAYYDNSFLLPDEARIRLVFDIDFGFTAIPRHILSFGENGTRIYYPTMGGQENLFPYKRLEANLLAANRHWIRLIYQPIDVRSRAVTDKEWRIYDSVFPSGTAMDLRYGFSFWRFSYLFDVLKSPDWELSFGLSFQIRNASIEFTAVDGSAQVVTQDIGPVPILALKFSYTGWEKSWLSFDLDGFYAAAPGLNGAGYKFRGWIYDGVIKYGIPLKIPADVFIALRLIGGGAAGTDETPDEGDGTTFNDLTTLNLSIGARIR